MHVMTKSIWAALLALGVLLPWYTRPVHAYPVCDVAIGPGHCYDTNLSQGLPGAPWADAAATAATVVFKGLPGHLVTITSLAESLFIRENFGDALTGTFTWIGLRQVGQTVEPGLCAQGPAGGWNWVTGEPFYSGPSSCGFENWDLSEPNEAGVEDCAHFTTQSPNDKGFVWNDINCVEQAFHFVIEWDIPEGVDVTAPNRPPVCDVATGHCYDTNVGQGMLAATWADAATTAARIVFKGQPGHLVTITSPSESGFIHETFGAFQECLSQVNAPWIGLRQVGQTVEPGSCAQGPAGGWSWVTGEPFYSGPSSCGFENWNQLTGEPDNLNPEEECAHLCHGVKWSDVGCNESFNFIIEWDVSQAGGAVNDFVAFEPSRSTFRFLPDPAGCPAGFVGTFSFEARLTNTSNTPLTALVVVVTTLSKGNLVHNADGGPAGVGAQLTVPPQDGFADGVLSPEEFVDVPFRLCLQEQSPFRFFMNVFGEVQ
jgi:hypothetical protein